jgi:hypothetical protein
MKVLETEGTAERQRGIEEKKKRREEKIPCLCVWV